MLVTICFSQKDPQNLQSEKMDAVDSVVDPLRDFAKDSVRLVKRCHKPDRKGRKRKYNNCLRISFGSVVFWSGFEISVLGLSVNVLFVDCGCRIHKGGVSYGDRIRGDGIRWLFREADIHSHQQHHRWLCLGIVYISIFL